MTRCFLIFLTLIVTGCAPFEPTNDVHIVVIDKPVTLSWGIRSPEGLGYQHDGIPGNLGHFPNTRTPQNDSLHAVVLGDALPPGARAPIRVIGVHEQVSRNGLMSTIIAVSGSGSSLESIENEMPGSLAVIEAGLVKLYGENARSLGFRSVDAAHKTIASHRDAFSN